MAFKDLSHFINSLEQAGELLKISTFVNPELEIAEITDRVSKMPLGGKALLFENNGTEFPILTNALGSYRRICIALGVSDLDKFSDEFTDLFKLLSKPKESFRDKLNLLPHLKQISSWIPKKINGRGDSQQVVMHEPDIGKIPVLKCWPADGGCFITLPMVITVDPKTGIRNVGMYRMQILEKNATAMHWHLHKVGARHYNDYKELGRKMPVAVALGGDPALMYSATAPLPDNIDEFMLAGFIRKKRVNMVRCLTQELDVPADADIIIEGYVDPKEEFVWEGPFGDHTGFYSLSDWYPKFHITCITHRKDAIYPATIVGVPPQEDAWIGKATERIFIAPIRIAILPEIVDMSLPFAGVAHNLMIIKIKKTYPGQAIKVMHALWGAGQMMFNKTMIVVDGEVNIHNSMELISYVFENTEPVNDVHFSKGPLDVLDHSSENYAFGGKMGIDATIKFPQEKGRQEVAVENTKEIIEQEIRRDFPEIEKFIRYSFGGKGLLLMTIKKDMSIGFRKLSEELMEKGYLTMVRGLGIFDYAVDISQLDFSLWIAANNIDPSRDGFIVSNSSGNSSVLCMDATRKTLKDDTFKRDWPNIVSSDNETINRVDKLWEYLKIGPFVASPSLKVRSMILNEGAVAK